MFHFWLPYFDTRFILTSFCSAAFLYSNTSYHSAQDSDKINFIIRSIASVCVQYAGNLQVSCAVLFLQVFV